MWRAFLDAISPENRGEAIERIAEARFHRASSSSALPSPTRSQSATGPTPVAPTPARPTTVAPTVAPTNIKKGQNLPEAKEMAPLVLERVANDGEKYPRPLVTQFQEYVGLAADGAYGPRTAGALAWALGIPAEKVPVSIAPKGAPLVPFTPKT